MNVFAIHRGVVAALAVAIVALVPSPGSAAIGVTPLTAALPPGASATASPSPIRSRSSASVQPQVYRWEHVNGKDQLTKSSDWIVNPPIAAIAPLGSRVVRMALEHRASPEETAYRLILSEVNSKEATSVGVAVSTNLSLPIFLEPAGSRRSGRSGPPRAARRIRSS